MWGPWAATAPRPRSQPVGLWQERRSLRRCGHLRGVGAGSMAGLRGHSVGCRVWGYPLWGHGVMVVVWLGGPASVPQAWATSAPLRHRCRPAMPLREGVGATRYGNPGCKLSFFFHRKNNGMGWSQAPGVVYCQVLWAKLVTGKSEGCGKRLFPNSTVTSKEASAGGQENILALTGMGNTCAESHAGLQYRVKHKLFNSILKFPTWFINLKLF